MSGAGSKGDSSSGTEGNVEAASSCFLRIIGGTYLFGASDDSSFSGMSLSAHVDELRVSSHAMFSASSDDKEGSSCGAVASAPLSSLALFRIIGGT
jgi:hypothetical protein